MIIQTPPYFTLTDTLTVLPATTQDSQFPGICQVLFRFFPTIFQGSSPQATLKGKCFLSAAKQLNFVNISGGIDSSHGNSINKANVWGRISVPAPRF
jgi:hypothetical protein